MEQYEEVIQGNSHNKAENVFTILIQMTLKYTQVRPPQCAQDEKIDKVEKVLRKNEELLRFNDYMSKAVSKQPLDQM